MAILYRLTKGETMFPFHLRNLSARWLVLLLLPILCSCGQELAGHFYNDLHYGVSIDDAKNGYSDVVVYYATNRAHQPDGSYTGDPGPDVRFGAATVRIDKASPLGGSNPFIAPFERQWAERDGKIVTPPAECDLTALFTAIKTASLGPSGTDNKPILIYVHGFNVDFDSSIRSAAKLALDLGNRVVPVLLTWPSQGRVEQYFGDENNAHLSGVALGNDFLKKFRDEVAAWPAQPEVHLLAHSLGSRVTLYSLEQLDAKPFLTTLTFAAPDVDRLEFQSEAPKMLDNQIAKRLTLYVGERDIPLAISQRLHGRYTFGESNRGRAGQAGDLLLALTHKNLEVIDATLADFSPTFHSYFQTNRAVLVDLYQSLIFDKPAAQRNLDIAQTAAGDRFWLIRP